MRLVNRVAAIVLIGLVPLITVQIYNSLALKNARKLEIQQLALRQAEYAASEIAQITEGMHSLMTAVSKAPVVRTLDTALCGRFIQDVLSDIKYVSILTVTDATGQIKCAPSPEMLTVNVSDRAYFKESQKNAN